MPKTQVTGKQILDASIGKSDLNITDTDEAVVTRVKFNSSQFIINSTSAVPGAGDITVDLNTTLLKTMPCLHVSMNADITATSSVITNFPFNKINYVDDNFFGFNATTYTVTIKQTGYYLILFNLQASRAIFANTNKIYYSRNDGANTILATIMVGNVFSSNIINTLTLNETLLFKYYITYPGITFYKESSATIFKIN